MRIQMAEISASLVKELRERTGVGMMDCKKALAETSGDIEAAVDWLRTKGLAKAAKKAGRTAAEGLVGIYTAGNKAAIVEVNSETDFVSRNEQFQNLVSTLAKLAIDSNGNLESLQTMSYPGSDRNVEEEVTHLIATIGENMVLRRTSSMSVNNGLVGTYMHSATAPGIGRIGVLVALESTAPEASLQDLAKQIAMHIAATNPQACTISELDPSLVERERQVFIEQTKDSGKPADIVEKMIEGRLRKYYEQVVLTEQTFIIDGERTISKVIEDAAKDAGSTITLKGFVRYELGEGVAKDETDFAAEVAAQLGK